MAAKKIKSADTVILEVLGYEFPFNDKNEAEQKIRRRLKYHHRPYCQDRVDLLRRFKDEIQAEFRRVEKSRYFVGCHGEYIAMEDFDVERMIKDFGRSFPGVPSKAVKWFIPFAVYLYYLR